MRDSGLTLTAIQHISRRREDDLSLLLKRLAKIRRKVIQHPLNPADNRRVQLTELIFWILSRLAPMLWYAHRLGYFLRLVVRVIEDEPSLEWLAENPEGRARLEGMLVDFEHVLDIIIGLKTRALLGLAMPADRPGLRRRARIHTAPSLDRLVLRAARLIARSQDADRLARRCAARLRNERNAAPVLLAADHRPVPATPAAPPILILRAPTRALAPITALRIRAPPRLVSNSGTQAHPNPLTL